MKKPAYIACEYGCIAGIALIAGFIATTVCRRELEPTPQPATTGGSQAELRAAASAALAFRKDRGRLPYTLDELRDVQGGKYLRPPFKLSGVMYFREEDGRPRLSWRADANGAAAFCSLDAALQGHC